VNYKEELELLLTIPGIKKDSAAIIIAEIGVDMTQFPTSQHLASWGGVSPGNHESAENGKAPVRPRAILISNQPCAKLPGLYPDVGIDGWLRNTGP